MDQFSTFSSLYSALALRNPRMAAAFNERFSQWLAQSPRTTSERHQLIIFLHVELGNIRNSIDIRGYISEDLSDPELIANIMDMAYNPLQRVWGIPTIGV